LKFGQNRPRSKGVTRKRTRRDTAIRNKNLLKIQQDRPGLTRQRNNSKNYNRKRKNNNDVADIVSIWPKIVEYIGLSEYESKVYLSLLNLGNAGARRLSLNCDVPRTRFMD